MPARPAALLGVCSMFALAGGSRLAAQTADAPGRPGIEDAWYVESYTLENGEQHAVEGLMVFSARDWAVVYFVDDDQGVPRRAAGEAGTYTLDGDRLVLTRLYLTISSGPIGSLPEIPLRFDVPARTDPVVERCTIALDGDRLVITFPSGNRMGFRRSTGGS